VWSDKRHVCGPLKPRLVLAARADHIAGGQMRHGSCAGGRIRSRANVEWTKSRLNAGWAGKVKQAQEVADPETL
jgi:hypothetical protein